MPRLTDSRRHARREQIADAALRCFGEKGFASTSMADISKASGLSAGSIYSHFASKADLMRFVAAGVLETRNQGLGADTTPGELLRSFLAPMDRSRAQLLLQLWAEAPLDPEVANLVEENLAVAAAQARTVLAPWIDARSASHGEDRQALEKAISNGILSAFQGCVVRLAVDPSLDYGALVSNLAAMLDRA